MFVSLLLIAAGGEIDLRYSPQLHRLRARYSHEESGAVESFQKHGFIENRPIEGIKIRLIQSQDFDEESHDPLSPLTPDEVADFCAKANEKNILITCELGLALEYARLIAWKNLDKVIMITGASIPPLMHESDADINLGFALAAAQLYPTAGVYIAYGGKLHIWHECRRTEYGFFSAPRLAPASAFA